LTPLFLIALQLHVGNQGMQALCETWSIGHAIHHNSIQTALLVSVSFFVISMQDSKIIDEAFADKVGRMLWTFPRVPLTHVSILWITKSWNVANRWLLVTSVIAGTLIGGQKNGCFVSNLQKADENCVLKCSKP
jgi:hypothetical protein